jgi:hypothetical protein
LIDALPPVGDREVRPKVEVLGAEENSDESDDKNDSDNKEEEDEEFDWYIQQEAPQEGEEVLGLNTTGDHGYGFGFVQVRVQVQKHLNKNCTVVTQFCCFDPTRTR